MIRKTGSTIRIFLTLSILLGWFVLPPCEGAAAADQPDPILVIVNRAYTASVFGSYLAEILRAEGLNAFTVMDLGDVTAATLSQHILVILAQTSLTSDQAALFTGYVNGGGRLLAMRPDPQIAGLFSLETPAATLDNGYVQLDTSVVFAGAAPGAGLASVPMQIHGTTDECGVTPGGTILARLYSNATNQTPYPAVVGSANGRAVAFAYDLPSSIVLMRQGNPANANQDIDNDDKVFRTIELFQAAGGGAPWVDRDLIPIPQADEQQRFLARLVKQMVAGVEPLPQVWYFPETHKTVMVLTGDAHANPVSYYQNEIEGVAAYGAKMTIYISIAGEPSPETIQAWQAQGFTFGLHPYASYPNTYPPLNCTTLAECYAVWDNWFKGQYPGITVSRTVRNHQVAWLGWTDAADLQAATGIGMDTSFYVWGRWLLKPDGSWPHGYSTGSGLPMKFARSDGTILPVFQQLTELVDEQLVTGSGNGYENLSPEGAVAVSRELIDASQNGYYSAITTQMHVDYYSNESRWVEGTLAYAQSLDIPLWNADQWYAFTLARYQAAFTAINWDGQRSLTFTMQAPDAPDINLTTVLPLNYAGKILQTVSVDGKSRDFSIQNIHGVDEAFISLASGVHTFHAVYKIAASPATGTPVPATATVSLPSQSTATVAPTAAPTVSPVPVFQPSNGSLGLPDMFGIFIIILLVGVLLLLLIRSRH